MYLFTEEDYNNAKFRDLLSCKCDVCGKEIYKSKKDIDASKSGNVFCSRSCAASYNNSHREFKQEWKDKISQKMRKNYKKERVCKICGQHECLYPHICKSSFIYQKSSNLEKLGFDFSKCGTFEIYDEYFRIQHILYTLYFEDEMSHLSIMDAYNIPSRRTITLLFNFFKLESRTVSEGMMVGYRQYRINPGTSNFYKSGWHTSWDNRQHYYRSSYEEDYMKELDIDCVEYYSEYFHISYFDTQLNIHRTAIPDFYIPSTNTIVEVKSEYTYDRQNMIDKVKSYRELGYNFKLLYEHIMYDDCV